MTIPRVKISYSEQNGAKLYKQGLVLIKNINLGYFFSDKDTANGDWNDLNNWWLDPELRTQASNLPTQSDNISVFSTISSNSDPFNTPVVNNIILAEGALIITPIIANNNLIINDIFDFQNESFAFITVENDILSSDCPSANYRGILAPDGNYYTGARWKDGIVGLTTDVGTNGGPSYYGTYDQTGNVWEIVDTIYSTGLKICSGGSYKSLLEQLTGIFSFFNFIGYDTTDNDIGFRILTIDDPYSYSTVIMPGTTNEFVDIINSNNSGDPLITNFENWSDTYGTGEIDYNYKILKYPVTNDEYCRFLNAVDPDGLDQVSLRKHIYNELMGSEQDIYMGGIDLDPLAAKGQKYKTATNMKLKPVVHVNWYNAARMCNWLHNGAPVFENTSLESINSYDSGIYINNNANNNFGDLITNINDIYYVEPKYRLPQFNEWYKAGFYEESISFTGYYPYSIRSFKDPIAVTANSVGSGILPTSCTETNDNDIETLDPCDINQTLTNIQYNYYYYNSNSPESVGEWFDINNWWLDAEHSVQSPIFPDEQASVYIQSSVASTGTAIINVGDEYNPNSGPSPKNNIQINPIKISNLFVSGCSVALDIECKISCCFVDSAIFGEPINPNLIGYKYKPSLKCSFGSFFENSVNKGIISGGTLDFYGPYEPIIASGPNNIAISYGYFATSCGDGTPVNAPLTTIYGQQLTDKGSVNQGLLVSSIINFYDTASNAGTIISIPSSIGTALSIAYLLSRETVENFLGIDDGNEIYVNIRDSRSKAAVAIIDAVSKGLKKFNADTNFYGYTHNSGNIICFEQQIAFFDSSRNDKYMLLANAISSRTNLNFVNNGNIETLGRVSIQGTNQGSISNFAESVLISSGLYNAGYIIYGCLNCGITATNLITISGVIAGAGIDVKDSSITSSGNVYSDHLLLIDSTFGGLELQFGPVISNKVTVEMSGNSTLSIDSYRNNEYHFTIGGDVARYNFQTNSFDFYPSGSFPPVGIWPECENVVMDCTKLGPNGFCFLPIDSVVNGEIVYCSGDA